MMNEPLSSIMTTEVITARPEDNLSVAIDIFKQNKVHHLPIVEGNTLVGIITTYDLFKFQDAKGNVESTLISDVMTTNLATLEPTDKIGSAAELFLENRFHAVPVVINRELKGIVTSFDIIKYNFRKEYPTQLI
jgi:CBS domain-containing protein